MGKVTGKFKFCSGCGKEFWLFKSRKTIFCSKLCYSKSQVGMKLLPHVKKIAIETLNKWKEKRINSIKGEENYQWKGDEVGYRGLHYWVVRQKGKAKICSLCGNNEGRMHWANIDHKYRRNVLDYFSACPKCHKRYDKKLKEKS